MEKLEKGLAARVNWGSCQHPVISKFDMSSAGERKLVDDASLSLVLSERLSEKKLFLFVDVEDKPREVIANSAVTEMVLSSVVSENASTHLIAEPGNATHVIDWDNLEILPIAEDQIGATLPLMDDDEMYAFVGLAATNERAEQESQATKNEKEGDDTTAAVTMDLQGADLLIDDVISGEESIFYDLEDPPMNVGSTYASMKEFRAAVRHHAIKGQFELGIEKSCKKVFRGYCKADGCPWAIVARTMRDGQQVRVYFTNFAFFSNFNLTFVPSSPFNHV
jgi:hypothetical protein